MTYVVSSYVKVMQRRQKLSFRLRNVILRDNLEAHRKHHKGERPNA